MWLARDKDGELFLFTSKPEKRSILWDSISARKNFMFIEDLFPEVKWEDEEPTEVELIIKQK